MKKDHEKNVLTRYADRRLQRKIPEKGRAVV